MLIFTYTETDIPIQQNILYNMISQQSLIIYFIMIKRINDVLVVKNVWFTTYIIYNRYSK